jgi:hypothetical protein
MSSITLDISDENAISRGITMLQRLMGNAGLAPAPTGATSKGTAATGAAHGKTAGASGQPAASAQAAQPGSTAATGEAGNATSAGSDGQASQGALAGASSSGPASAAGGKELTFDEVKKPFLALSQTKGRPACEAVLGQFKLAKLSDAKPEQWAQLKAAIDKAAA